MRRLPNTYPGNTTLYPTGRGTISIGAADPGSKVLFYNETPVNLDLDFYNGDTDVLHAWEANFWILDGETADITWSIDIDSLNVVNPPINAVFTTVFSPTERLNDKAYPMPLIRQIGGQTTVSNIATNVSNESNAGSTEIIDIGTSGNTKLIDVFNDHFIWQVLQSGVVHQVLKGQTAGNPLQIGQAGDISEVLGQLTVDQAVTLAAVGLLTHVLGNLTVDGNTTHTGTTAHTGAATFAAAGASITTTNDTVVGGSVKTNSIRDNVTGTDLIDLTTNQTTLNQNVRINAKKLLDGSGNNLIDWSVSGNYVKGNPAVAGPFHYQGDGTNTDFQIGAIGPAVTGSASATVNHLVKQFGASIAPTDFYMNPSTASGSQTFGFNTITSTQVNVVLGATNAYRFRGWL